MKYKLKFNGTPKVVYLDKKRAPKGCQELTVLGKTVYLEECSYNKAVGRIQHASANTKNSETVRVLLKVYNDHIMDTEDEATFMLMLMDFSEWNDHIDI